MITPTVSEQQKPLEPVGRDTFIAALELPVAPPSRPRR